MRLKRVLLCSGIAVITVTLLTGCGNSKNKIRQDHSEQESAVSGFL